MVGRLVGAAAAAGALAPAAPAWAQSAGHAGMGHLDSAMNWSGVLIGFMPYVLALIVAAVVLYQRRRRARSGERGDGDGQPRS